MSRSHYPVQGGPRRATWNRAEARHKPRQTPAAYHAPAGTQEITPEITRQKEAVQCLPSQPSAAVIVSPSKVSSALRQQAAFSLRPFSRPDNRALLIIAAVLCAAAILFALIVMKQRG